MSIETVDATADTKVTGLKEWVKTHQVPLILAAALVIFVVEWVAK